MTFASNDPIWWPYINLNIFYSYWTVAASVVVVYDWVLTLGQEIELIWRQRWSLMTVLYLIIRYIGILIAVANPLPLMPLVSLTDAGCKNVDNAQKWAYAVLAAILGAIMIARLYAMYQRSRIMLIFLVIIFLVVFIACEVLAAKGFEYIVAEEMILSGMCMCGLEAEGDVQLLLAMAWMLNTIWEVLALCLSVWIAVKHFRDLRRLGPSTGLTIRDCFKVLIKSHVLYFASFAGASCLQLIIDTSDLWTLNSIRAATLHGASIVLLVVQTFVFGPRLILSVREYHAKLVAYSDTETSMNSIVFQEHVHVSTSSTV